jgi:hypothetical protein
LIGLDPEWPASADSHRCLYFLIGYFGYSLAVIALELLLADRDWYAPLAIDLALIAILIYLSPIAVPIWFPFLFISYAAGSRWGLRTAIPISGALALLITFLNVVERDARASISSPGSPSSLPCSPPAPAGTSATASRFPCKIIFSPPSLPPCRWNKVSPNPLRLFLEELAQSFC